MGEHGIDLIGEKLYTKYNSYYFSQSARASIECVKSFTVALEAVYSNFLCTAILSNAEALTLFELPVKPCQFPSDERSVMRTNNIQFETNYQRIVNNAKLFVEQYYRQHWIDSIPDEEKITILGGLIDLLPNRVPIGVKSDFIQRVLTGLALDIILYFDMTLLITGRGAFDRTRYYMNKDMIPEDKRRPMIVLS